jgi:hypothetical protein
MAVSREKNTFVAFSSETLCCTVFRRYCVLRRFVKKDVRKQKPGGWHGLLAPCLNFSCQYQIINQPKKTGGM